MARAKTTTTPKTTTERPLKPSTTLEDLTWLTGPRSPFNNDVFMRIVHPKRVTLATHVMYLRKTAAKSDTYAAGSLNEQVARTLREIRRTWEIHWENNKKP